VKGVSWSNRKSFGVIVLKCHILRNDGVDWCGVFFWRDDFRRLGLWTINVGLKIDGGLLVSFARILNLEILCT